MTDSHAPSIAPKPQRTRASAPMVFGIVLVSELLRIRLEWFWYLVQMSFQPVAMLVFVYFLWQDPRAATYAITGSLVVTMSSSAMLSLGQHVGWMKTNNAYEHYAALPISRGVFVAAIATRGVILALPSIITLVVIGTIFLGVRLSGWGLLVLLLGAYSMSGLGAFIGFWSRDGQTSSLATQVLGTIIIFLTPVYIPLEQLPRVLSAISPLIPTTYAARALRNAVAGVTFSGLWPDLLVLLGFALVSLILVPLRLPWRRSV